MNGLYLAVAGTEGGREGRDVEEQSGCYLALPGPAAAAGQSGRDDEDGRAAPPTATSGLLRGTQTETARPSTNYLGQQAVSGQTLVRRGQDR